jgi:hypothetical protein
MQLAQRLLNLRRRLPGPVSDLRAARNPEPAARAPSQAQTHSPAATVDGATAAAPVVPPVFSDPQATGSPRANAKKRRSPERSAQRHAARQRRIRTRIIAVLFLLKLRRRARQRRAAVSLMELSSPTPPASASSKRGRSNSPASRYAGSSAGRTPPSAGSRASCGSPEDCADGSCELRAVCAREKQ